MRWGWLVAAFFLARPAELAAQSGAERDARIFGSPEPEPESTGANPPATGPTEGAPSVPRATDVSTSSEQPPSAAASAVGASGEGGPRVGPPSPSAEGTNAEDTLTFGGLLYLRTRLFALESQKARDFAFSAPSLADLYMDVRPSDRVRGFALARIAYDPTLRPGSASARADAGSVGSGNDGSSLSNPQRAELQVLLDQFWLRFDVARTVFVTAGRQHVRWGTARFWTPTDYLHATNRSPLDVFDARPGTSMLKLHLPIESLAWNFYGYAIVETDRYAVTSVSRVAGALRSEIVLGTGELGLGVLARRGETPRLAADASAGLGPLDVYGELALRDAGEIDRVRFDPDAMIPAPASVEGQDPAVSEARRLAQVVELAYPAYRDRGMKAQAVAGVTYSHPYNAGDVITVAAEYFYNGLGYDSPAHYPGLVLPRPNALANPASFFYLGRHYAGLAIALPRPFSLNLHSFTLSTVGNLSDRSFISRVDYSYVINTHLTLELFGAVRYGSREGEFRLGVRGLRLAEVELNQAPALFDLGVALRLPI